MEHNQYITPRRPCQGCGKKGKGDTPRKQYISFCLRLCREAQPLIELGAGRNSIAHNIRRSGEGIGNDVRKPLKRRGFRSGNFSPF